MELILLSSHSQKNELEKQGQNIYNYKNLWKVGLLFSLFFFFFFPNRLFSSRNNLRALMSPFLSGEYFSGSWVEVYFFPQDKSFLLFILWQERGCLCNLPLPGWLLQMQRPVLPMGEDRYVNPGQSLLCSECLQAAQGDGEPRGCTSKWDGKASALLHRADWETRAWFIAPNHTNKNK